LQFLISGLIALVVKFKSDVPKQIDDDKDIYCPDNFVLQAIQ